jgi:hypothetical protein
MPEVGDRERAHAPVAEGVDAVGYQPFGALHHWSGPGLPLPHRPMRPGSRPQDGFLKVGKSASVFAAPMPIGSATSGEQARSLDWVLRLVYLDGTVLSVTEEQLRCIDPVGAFQGPTGSLHVFGHGDYACD